MIKGGYGIQRMCINMLYHHTLQNPPVCFPILHHNCFHNTCPYPIYPMKQGICGNDGLIILFCRKTKGRNERVPYTQAITRAGQGPPGVA